MTNDPEAATASETPKASETPGNPEPPGNAETPGTPEPPGNAETPGELRTPGAALDPVEELAGRIPSDDTGFAASLLRGRCVAGREVLARRATGGRLGDDALIEVGVALADGSGDRAAVPDGESRLLAAYAYVLGVQLGTDREQRAALGLLDALAAAGVGLTTAQAETRAQLLLAAGRLDDATDAAGQRPVRPGVRSITEADSRNPRLRPGVSEPEWIAGLSRALVKPGIIPLTLAPAGRTTFDRLTSGAPERAGSIRGPLVAVVMSAYDPDERIVTAVNSLIEQTWADWELLIVDDASPAPLPGILDRVAGLDSRVRVIRKAVNGGTYRARNTALAQTGAEFFTCLDSDDWAHPQRLEKGMEPLLADPELMATRSMCVRADEDLVITRPGYHGHIVNAPSLLVRMYPAVHRLGFFDTVRKAADTEYAVRLEAVFGTPVETLRDNVLTMARHEATSLSFGEFAPGWRHGARSAYRQAYGRWHEEIRAGADPFLDPEAPRMFPAPARWMRPVDARLAAPRVLDVVLCDDVRTGGRAVPGALARARALTAAGHRVGLLHTENLVDFTPDEAPLDPAIQALIDEGQIERIHLEDDLRTRLVVVGDPELMQFPPWAARSFAAERVLVLDPGGALADPATARANASALFGPEPLWGTAPATDPHGVDGIEALLARTRARSATSRDHAAESGAADAPAAEDHTWLTIATRRPGDGESADGLAVRHTADADGAAAAAEFARRLLAALPDGAPATADLVADLAVPAVVEVAQNLSGQVTRLPVRA